MDPRRDFTVGDVHLMYCPYCGIEHSENDTLLSVEHVIPFAIGGSDALTITTCAKANNDLGSAVDAPFIDSFVVNAKRFFLGLESASGNPPSFDLGGIGWVDGKEVPISYLISPKNKELKISKPTLDKKPGPNGTEHWHLSGEPGQVRKMLEGKLRKQLELGKSITLEDGSLLRLEDLDQLFADRTKTFNNPSVMKTIQHDYLDYIHFFSKLALAIGHLHLGDAFSRSPIGDRLRNNMTAATMEGVRAPGHIWPETEAVEGALQMIAKADHHTLAIMEGELPVLLVSLFGEIGAVIPLGDPPPSRPARMSDDGVVWQIALPSRLTSKLTLVEMVAERVASRRAQMN